LTVEERVCFPVLRGEMIGHFFPDLMVDGLVLVEVKSRHVLATLEPSTTCACPR
jgi:hypothetical protein